MVITMSLPPPPNPMTMMATLVQQIQRFAQNGAKTLNDMGIQMANGALTAFNMPLLPSTGAATPLNFQVPTPQQLLTPVGAVKAIAAKAGAFPSSDMPQIF